jgi:DNA-directed RNA polymerase subunit RPC12/RpoP
MRPLDIGLIGLRHRVGTLLFNLFPNIRLVFATEHRTHRWRGSSPIRPARETFNLSACCRCRAVRRSALLLRTGAPGADIRAAKPSTPNPPCIYCGTTDTADDTPAKSDNIVRIYRCAYCHRRFVVKNMPEDPEPRN